MVGLAEWGRFAVFGKKLKIKANIRVILTKDVPRIINLYKVECGLFFCNAFGIALTNFIEVS